MYRRIPADSSWNRPVVSPDARRANVLASARFSVCGVGKTKPSHSLADYVGTYENSAYGVLKIGLANNELQFDFHKIKMPLSHFH